MAYTKQNPADRKIVRRSPNQMASERIARVLRPLTGSSGFADLQMAEDIVLALDKAGLQITKKGKT